MWISENIKKYHIYFNLRSSDDGYTDFYTYVRKIVLVLKAIKTSESPSLGLWNEASEISFIQ